MASKTSSDDGSAPPTLLSNDEVKRATILLQNRVADLEIMRTKLETVSNRDIELDALESKINSTVSSIFRVGSPDYHRLCARNLKCEPVAIYPGMDFSYPKRRLNIIATVETVMEKLRSEVDVLQERSEIEETTPAAKSLRAYNDLSLHKEIERVASSRYKSGHYADAIEASVKALNGLVRFRSSLELDGSALMQKAFTPNNPLIKFSELKDQSDKDEQQGFMMLFTGAVAGLRNPRAHGFVRDDPERALEFIAFVSLLAKLLDEAES